MNPSEVSTELEQPGAQELLHSATLARLAYTGLDGFPRVIPIGFLWNGRQIVVCTAPTSPKVPAIRVNGHVALTIDNESAQALLVRGLASSETVDGVPDEFIEAAKKSMEGEHLQQFEEGSRSTYKQMVRIAVQPQWARFYDFGAGRTPQFLTRLVENS